MKLTAYVRNEEGYWAFFWGWGGWMKERCLEGTIWFIPLDFIHLKLEEFSFFLPCLSHGLRVFLVLKNFNISFREREVFLVWSVSEVRRDGRKNEFFFSPLLLPTVLKGREGLEDFDCFPDERIEKDSLFGMRLEWKGVGGWSEIFLSFSPLATNGF